MVHNALAGGRRCWRTRHLGRCRRPQCCDRHRIRRAGQHHALHSREDPMSQKCTITGCGRECEFYACWDCINDTIRLLRELELYVADTVPAMRQKLRGEPGRGDPGYGPRSPGRDDIIIALDPRPQPGSVDEDGNATTRRPDDAPRWIRSIPASISAIADWVATERGDDPGRPSTFVQDMGYVRRSLPWCAQQATRDDDG